MNHKARILKLYHDGWTPLKIYKVLSRRLGYRVTVDDVYRVIYGD